ncbi:MAG: glycerophosphodiester phosphodiesterase [Bdellovibrionota bacterium]
MSAVDLPYRYIAHRCQGFESPENSEASLRKALVSRAHEVELDLYASGSDGFVASHWPPWLTGGSCSRMTLESLMRVFGELGGRKGLRLDLKSVGSEERLLDLLRKWPFYERITVMSRSPSALVRLRRQEPPIRTSLSLVLTGSRFVDSLLYSRAMTALTDRFGENQVSLTLASLSGAYSMQLIDRAVTETAELVVCVRSELQAQTLSARGVSVFLSKVPLPVGDA